MSLNSFVPFDLRDETIKSPLSVYHRFTFSKRIHLQMKIYEGIFVSRLYRQSRLIFIGSSQRKREICLA